MNHTPPKLRSHCASDVIYSATPQALRHKSGTTAGHAPGYLQGNLTILPTRYAEEFLRYCARNPKACPLIGVSAPGSPHLPELGADIDVRTDLPGYRIFRGGSDYTGATDLSNVWRDDLVCFVLGCSFSFEEAMIRAGVRLRHIKARRNVAMYVSAIATRAAGGGSLRSWFQCVPSRLMTRFGQSLFPTDIASRTGRRCTSVIPP